MHIHCSCWRTMLVPCCSFYDVKGQWAEEGVVISPDIAVEQTPADVIKGRDPQLERAVKEEAGEEIAESVMLKVNIHKGFG